MYFVIGGRNTASKLYRIRHTGEKGDPGEPARLVENQALRDLRHSLERFHGKREGGIDAVNEAWPHLSHEDRNIRYAARLAVENQDLALWQDKVFSELDPRALIYAAIALCRHGDKSLSGRVLGKLGEIPFETLEPGDRLALLRAYSLCFIRMDKPEPEQVAAVIAKLDPFYPASDDLLNAELCRVLCYLDAPQVVGKTIGLMKSTQTKTIAYDKAMFGPPRVWQGHPEDDEQHPEQPEHPLCLCAPAGAERMDARGQKILFWLVERDFGKRWRKELRRIYQSHPGGRDQAPGCGRGRCGILAPGGDRLHRPESTPDARGCPVAWTVDSAMELFESELEGRDFKNGEKMFSAGRCVACHRFGGSGGYSGPDLGSVGNRYSIRDILVAICEPSQSISEQYQASTVTLKDGGSDLRPGDL